MVEVLIVAGGKVDISKLVRGGFQLLTKSHKSYSLTSSPFNNEVPPIRPVHSRRPRGFSYGIRPGGDGSRVTINLALHLLPFWPKYGQEPDASAQAAPSLHPLDGTPLILTAHG